MKVILGNQSISLTPYENTSFASINVFRMQCIWVLRLKLRSCNYVFLIRENIHYNSVKMSLEDQNLSK